MIDKKNTYHLAMITKTSPNYSLRPLNAKIEQIILHCSDSQHAVGVLAWFALKKSQVSAHYVLSKKGIVHAVVDEKYSAWHTKKHNAYSIGIEIVGSRDDLLTEDQKESLEKLLAYLLKKYDLKPDVITGHKFADSETTKTCPGCLFGNHGTWEEFLAWRDSFASNYVNYQT